MTRTSKGASEKRRLTQYVTNTVLDDNFKGTTEQFVLHFNEQFRQLEEISEDNERLPPTVKLTLLQTAVRSINDFRIVETLDEFQSTTHGHGSSTSLSYDTYYDLLINACVRYDKTKWATIGKRRPVSATNIDETYIDSPTACIDHVPVSPYGGIDLPPDEFYQVHALSSRHPPSPRPGQPSRPSFRPQSQHSKLEEISDDSERLPPTVKLTLLQTAVRSINDLRIVETLDEFQSTTHGHGSSTSLSYDTYYDLLINACVRYDKTKKANIGKRRNVYTTNIDETYVDHPTACIDHVLDSPYGGIDLPPDEFYQVHALSSRHPPSPRPGQPSRPSFRPQSQHSGPTKPIRRYDGPIFLPTQI